MSDELPRIPTFPIDPIREHLTVESDVYVNVRKDVSGKYVHLPRTEVRNDLPNAWEAERSMSVPATPVRWDLNVFIMPGGKSFAGQAHHQQQFSFASWDPRRKQSEMDQAKQPAVILEYVWDYDVNGHAEAFEACSDDVVSARCLTRRNGNYSQRHRYWTTVRQLAKGLRCPTCLPKAKTMKISDSPHAVAAFACDLNAPYTPEMVPAIRGVMIDMRCPVCSTQYANFGDLLTRGKSGEPPQGCPRCNMTVSRTERIVADAIRAHARRGVNVTTQERVGAMSVDVAISGDDLLVGYEYDGSYYHLNRFEDDKRKSVAMREKGYIVVRHRDHTLRDIPGTFTLRQEKKTHKAIAGEAVTFLHENFPTLITVYDPQVIDGIIALYRTGK